MSLANDRERIAVLVWIDQRKGERLPDNLTDVLADKAYNLIAISGKTANVCAQIVKMPALAWEGVEE